MRLLALLALPALLSAQGGSYPQDPATDLRSRLYELKVERAEKAGRMDELIRMRIDRDLLLPLENLGIFEPASGDRKASPEELERMLVEETRKTRDLKVRLAKLGRGYRPLDLGVPSLRANPGRGIDPPPKGPEVFPEPSEAPADTGDGPKLGPRTEGENRPGPKTEPTMVADPFAADGIVKARLRETDYTIKRFASLIEAGMARHAVRELEDLLGKNGEDATLMFLKARAFEIIGKHDEALAGYKRVTELDTEENADGKKMIGPWGQAALFATKHIEWRARESATTLPDLKELKW
ncbi:MAG: hypothetical protein ACE5F1_05465 [Planctomycetota bacterium]